jgi:hypothetical protein
MQREKQIEGAKMHWWSEAMDFVAKRMDYIEVK